MANSYGARWFDENWRFCRCWGGRRARRGRPSRWRRRGRSWRNRGGRRFPRQARGSPRQRRWRHLCRFGPQRLGALRGRCRSESALPRRLRVRAGRLRGRRCGLLARAAGPAARLEPPDQLTRLGRTEVGVPICPPQGLAGARHLGVAPIAHLAGRACGGVRTRQLDPTHRVAVPAPELGSSCRVPDASCKDSKHQERLPARTPRHQIGTNVCPSEFNPLGRPSKIA